MRSTTGPLRVWNWYCYDPGLHQQVVYAAAACRPEDLRAVRTRLRLPEPVAISRLHPSTPGYAEAAAAPLRALWMPLEEFAARSTAWRKENQLAIARLRLALTQFPGEVASRGDDFVVDQARHPRPLVAGPASPAATTTFPGFTAAARRRQTVLRHRPRRPVRPGAKGPYGSTVTDPGA